MEYPNNYETSAFPAGKQLALSRFAAVFSMISFALVVCVCGFLFFLQKHQGISPLIIYADAPNGEWELIAPKRQESQIPYYGAIQKAIAGIITEKWFRIAGDVNQNERMWTECNREMVCSKRVTSNLKMTQGCDIFCLTSDEVYSDFEDSVLPDYRMRESSGETWFVIPNSVKINPVSTPTAKGGLWRATATIISNKVGKMDIIAFIEIAHQNSQHQQNLGFYVSNFNSYKIK